MKELYTTAQAAEYLGLSVSTVKYHVYEGNLKPKKPGHDLIFTRAMLDEFEANKRRPGRPRKGKEQAMIAQQMCDYIFEGYEGNEGNERQREKFKRWKLPEIQEWLDGQNIGGRSLQELVDDFNQYMDEQEQALELMDAP